MKAWVASSLDRMRRKTSLGPSPGLGRGGWRRALMGQAPLDLRSLCALLDGHGPDPLLEYQLGQRRRGHEGDDAAHDDGHADE